jgi:glycosyltransferase involved in cell wall biosynthesis
MHALFVHQNFPAQFGHVASVLAREQGWKCTFVSQKPAAQVGGIELVPYKVTGAATNTTHYCSRTFENCTWHTHAVYEALKARPDLRPDLIVGHSGFGSTLFLNELYPKTPIINYFEYFYHAHNSDMDYRPEFPSLEIDRLRARSRNAMLLLDLHNCSAGYSPTTWQRDRLPLEYRQKVRVIFDGVDREVWKPIPNLPRVVNGVELPAGQKIVTYATRGMESMRGFDIFMKVAGELTRRRPDVHIVVAGQDRVCYGGDARFTGGKSFKEWVLSRGDYDLNRFTFTGLIPPLELAKLFNLSDLHLYLTVPFVLSWSLFNAMACGCLVLASSTGPVMDLVEDGRTGLLKEFYDVGGMVAVAERALDRPDDFRPLRAAAVEQIATHYGLETCLPQLQRFYEDVANGRAATIAAPHGGGG